MSDLGPPLVNGIVMGGAYILIAMGFALVYGVFRVMNFAHADIYMIGGYIVFTLSERWGVSYALSSLAAVAVCMIIGLLIERGIFRPLWGKPAFTVAMASIGLSMVFQDGAKSIWTAQSVMFQTPYTREFLSIAGVRLSWQKAIIVIVSIVLIGALIYLVQRTNLGKAIRAVAQDRQAAGWVGIDSQRIAMVTFAIGAGLAGTAAPLLVPILSLDPFVGETLILKAFVIVLLGGYSLPGVIVGGLFVGIVQSFTATYVSVLFVDSITFGIMILLFVFRPSGIVRERVEENV